MRNTLRAGDEDALAQATMLQGVLSGDVIAASMHARHRLQRENLQLRRRLTLARIKTEAAKQILFEAEAHRSEATGEITALQIQRIREVYGLENHPFLQLPPAPQEKTLDVAPGSITEG